MHVLRWAAYHSNRESVNLLINKGADIGKLDLKGRSVLSMVEDEIQKANNGN